MLKLVWTVFGAISLCGAAFNCAVAETISNGLTSKVLETFDQRLWINSPWNSGIGRTLLTPDTAPVSKSQGSMEFQAKYSGNGFESVLVVPPSTLTIPGELKTLTIQVKRNDKRYGLEMSFLDGWGREKVGEAALNWDMRLADTDVWQTCTFKIPEDWVQPVTIQGIFTHNWETKTLANTVSFRLGQLEAVTDLRNVDPASGILTTWRPRPRQTNDAPKTPLVDINVSTGLDDNVFAGEDPTVTVEIRNWKPDTLAGNISCRILDDQGVFVGVQNTNVKVDSIAAYTLPLVVEKFGRYKAKVLLSLADGTQNEQEITFAKLPPFKELTEEQKMTSPYGLNVHSGDRLVIDPFKKAGIVWFREYAFQWDWILRAKGVDRRYAGWPYYEKMVQAYTDAGVKVLPVTQGALKPPQIINGKVEHFGPDEEWTREMASLMLAFPQVTHWELANEYDLPGVHSKTEALCDWANYRAYHRQFADILSIIGGPEKVAVENGRAGIWPKREMNCALSGDFAKIGVVNSHYYCGTEAPELSYENFNMGFNASEQQLGCLYDLLRAVKQAAQADGRKRESWLTEFGWDTLAGPMVSPYEQAVFLPRAWMLAMAAGTDKAFWFYNFDAPNPRAFFDGCGLLAADGSPKLSLCSLAGMTSILRAPHFIGSLDDGDNTWGYVFESEGKRIAALWIINRDKGPVVRFKGAQLYDYLGNKMPGESVQLSMAPIYAVGLGEEDEWWKQTVYSLKTPLLIGATAGDGVNPIVTINNNRHQPIDCKISLALPEGWTATIPEVLRQVQPGETVDVAIPFTIGSPEAQGIRNAKVVISEGKKLKEIPFRVMVQPALIMQAGAIVGPPGPAYSPIHLVNLSSRTRSVTLRTKTPRTWNVPAPAIEVNDLKAGESRDLRLALNWSPNWEPSESADVELDDGSAKSLIQPLIPNEYRLYPAGKIKLDGDLSQWPAGTELPNWILGSTHGSTRARVYLAWASEGLYGAVEVHDSRDVASDPTSFWTCDALELCIDTLDNKQPHSYASGDHHFWFVPLVGKNRVYVGQWKHGDELTETKSDIQGIQSSAHKSADGYVMQFLLPAALIQHYRPSAGSKLGLNLNLSIHGQESDREVYWPNTKASEATVHPEVWGTLDLAN